MCGWGFGKHARECPICNRAIPSCVLVPSNWRGVNCYHCGQSVHYGCAMPIHPVFHDCALCDAPEYARGDPLPDLVVARVASDGAWLREHSSLAGSATLRVSCSCEGTHPGRNGARFHEFTRRANADVISGTPAIAEMAGLFLALELCEELLLLFSPSRTWHFELICDNKPLVTMINEGAAYEHCRHLGGLIDEFVGYVADLKGRCVRVAGRNVAESTESIHGETGTGHQVRLQWQPRTHEHLGHAHKLAYLANYRNHGARTGRWRRHHMEAIRLATTTVAHATAEEYSLWESY